MFRNLFYENISTIWGKIYDDRNVFILGVYYILGRFLSGIVMSTLASPALRGYLKEDRNTYSINNNTLCTYDCLS
jgi:hypothetical protein